jgi:hypothetical protein
MPKKQLEILTFEKNKIEVTVKLDYLAKTISLVETTKNQMINENRKIKQYIFAGRNADFVNNWMKILDAIRYAMIEAKNLMLIETGKTLIQTINSKKKK